MDELAALQDAIQCLHQLMVTLTNPKDVSMVSQCLKALAGIQQEMMQKRPQGAQQAVLSQLQAPQQGGGGGY